MIIFMAWLHIISNYKYGTRNSFVIRNASFYILHKILEEFVF